MSGEQSRARVNRGASLDSVASTAILPLGATEQGLCARLSVLCLVLVALGVLHGLFYHLHVILVPFVLSVFLVLFLQHYVEWIYVRLSGREAPFRWCCCGLRRKSVKRGPDISEALASPRSEVSPESLCASISDQLCRFVAVSIVLISVLLVVVCVLVLLAHGAVHMKQHWGAYRKGTYRLIARMDKFLDLLCKEFRIGKISDKHMKDAYASVLTKAEEFLWEVLNTVASGFSEGVSTSFIVFLYVMFWLLQPLPTGGKAGRLVRRYVFFKTLVSALYGGCVTLLFFALGIDLAVLFGVISFFLNFVPEVGAFISILVPIPVIILDGRIQRPFLVLGMATLGQLILKFVFGTVLEVYLIEKDREMSIHPVWVILGLSYFGFVWGPTGMLISVPLLAMLKTAVITAHSELAEVSGPGQDNWKYICEAFLVCLEGGRRAAEHGEGASKDSYGSITEEKPSA